MAKESFLMSLRTQIPAMLCLEHLYSDYSSLKSEKDIKIAAHDEEFIENLYEKRNSTPPTWHDLYRFELILANHIPIGKLRGKVVRLRYDYRSVVGQKEFDDYLASKPPDLQTPPDPVDPPDAHVNYEKLVREDLKDLLDRLYLRYAILPVKEKKMKKLTAVAAGLCLLSLLFLLGVATYLFICPPGGKCFSSTDALGNISSLTILVVVVTGAMGGFVSALKRIQSQPVEGDSVYNLSLLFYGSYSVFVAPITGAIFAILLYLMFTSQVLTGAFFPRIYTPAALETTLAKETANPKNTSRDAAAAPPQISETRVADALQTNTQPSAASGSSDTTANENTANPTATPKPSATPSPKDTSTPKPTPEPVPEKSLKVLEFLVESGPAGGKDYALLILWCFIAGFAERFVPDALDRFISRNNKGDSAKT